ncbi:MAG: UTP--glucose-1-phosphate uridylyltransferase [Thermodesulfobacteriota bacterium]
MPTLNNNLSAFVEKMEKAGLAPPVIETFCHYYRQVIAGETGLMPESDIAPIPPEEVQAADTLSKYRSAGQKALKKSAIVVLNGGLGTSMGLTRAKSLIKVKDGLSFLEIKLRQSEKTGARLVLMNSFNTHADTLKVLADIPKTTDPLCFVQNKFPKISRADFSPASWPNNPELEWNPPGHGDIYIALYASGLLEKLLEQGIAYAFISNSDNLGATLDPSLLGYVSSLKLPFMMEVARRTPADRKGGHIARHKDGRIILREIAQCPEDEIKAFQDIRRYAHFNTNNIWVNLSQLYALIQKKGALKLPIIMNPKPLDPRNESSPKVYQVETAMGSAISLFKQAAVTQISDDRFYPVKNCTDLLAIQSDCYHMTPDFNVVKNPARQLNRIQISLDPVFFGNIDMYNARFSHGVPSLVECASLDISGDIFFEGNVVIKGRVAIKNQSNTPVVVKQGTVIENDLML